MAASPSLRLATDCRMPRSSRVRMMSSTPGRRGTSPSSRRMPSHTVWSRSHTTHLTAFGFFAGAAPAAGVAEMVSVIGVFRVGRDAFAAASPSGPVPADGPGDFIAQSAISC
ncbi:MAG TPA: hypothetical protein VM759_10205, partial [Longimicrobium sp.]|nr:hypothetical protein [Longimicrobium sp.]